MESVGTGERFRNIAVLKGTEADRTAVVCARAGGGDDCARYGGELGTGSALGNDEAQKNVQDDVEGTGRLGDPAREISHETARESAQCTPAASGDVLRASGHSGQKEAQSGDERD